MRLVIIDTKKDRTPFYKQYPYPMLFIEENNKYIVVENQGFREKIFKNKIKKINNILITKKEFDKVK